jgi:hypothetical protein
MRVCDVLRPVTGVDRWLEMIFRLSRKVCAKASFMMHYTHVVYHCHVMCFSRLCMLDSAYVSAVRSAFHECCAYPERKLRQSAEGAEPLLAQRFMDCGEMVHV